MDELHLEEFYRSGSTFAQDPKMIIACVKLALQIARAATLVPAQYRYPDPA